MKTKKIAINFHLVLLILTILFIAPSCNLTGEENSKCGALYPHVETVSIDSLIAGGSTLIDGIRTYQYFFEVDEICPYEHIDVTWQAVLGNVESTLVDQIKISGEVWWNLTYLQTKELTITSQSDDYNHYTGTQNLGLNSFGDEPAWAFFTLYFSFESQGNELVDGTVLLSIFHNATVRVDYYLLK